MSCWDLFSLKIFSLPNEWWTQKVIVWENEWERKAELCVSVFRLQHVNVCLKHIHPAVSCSIQSWHMARLHSTLSVLTFKMLVYIPVPLLYNLCCCINIVSSFCRIKIFPSRKAHSTWKTIRWSGNCAWEHIFLEEISSKRAQSVVQPVDMWFSPKSSRQCHWIGDILLLLFFPLLVNPFSRS